MARVLVYYASTHGQTAKIARRIAEVLREAGHDAEAENAAAADRDPAGYDGVIVAASLHAGRHQSEVVSWVREHREELGRVRTLFLSVSLTAAEDTLEATTATRACIDRFCDETGWRPDKAVPLAGALEYREYDPFTRLLMRLKMRQGGHPTDTSHDYDYTNWFQVEDLAREFAEALEGG